jgi:hypothetical protein
MNGYSKLVAFRVERRSIAVAVFHGTHLDYAAVKQLASDHQKAEVSAIGFVNWITSTFHITSAVMEIFENGQEMLRAQLHLAISQNLNSGGAAIYKVGNAELFEAFGNPPIKSRKELRQVITTIWPILETKRESGIGTKLDAVALGLYFQTERLFQH